MNYYFNNLHHEAVRNVFKYIVKNQKNNLVYNVDQTVNKMVKLSYCSSLHKLIISDHDINEPLYPNPTVECYLLPEEAFIDKVLRGSFNESKYK
jgi:hypothetical protein